MVKQNQPLTLTKEGGCLVIFVVWTMSVLYVCVQIGLWSGLGFDLTHYRQSGLVCCGLWRGLCLSSTPSPGWQFQASPRGKGPFSLSQLKSSPQSCVTQMCLSILPNFLKHRSNHVPSPLRSHKLISFKWNPNKMEVSKSCWNLVSVSFWASSLGIPCFTLSSSSPIIFLQHAFCLCCSHAPMSSSASLSPPTPTQTLRTTYPSFKAHLNCHLSQKAFLTSTPISIQAGNPTWCSHNVN